MIFSQWLSKVALIALLVNYWVAVCSTSAADRSTTELRDAFILQYLLIWTGHYTGFIDGIVGEHTLKALKEFQHEQDFPESAKATKEQLEWLRDNAEEKVAEFGFKLRRDKNININLALPSEGLLAVSKHGSGTLYKYSDGTEIRTERRTATIDELYYDARSDGGLIVSQDILEDNRFFVVGRTIHIRYYTGRTDGDNSVALYIKYNPFHAEKWDMLSVLISNYFHYPTLNATLDSSTLTESSAHLNVGTAANSDAGKVMTCLKEFTASHAKMPTIKEMQSCAGFWVTPKALLLCSLGSNCPRIEDKEVLESALKGTSITLDSPLTINASDISLPSDSSKFVDCRRSSKDADEFVACAASAVTGSKAG